jgi:hypothetical protein
MKVSSLLKKIADQVETVTALADSAYLYNPNLDLGTLTRPFAVVRSTINSEAVISFSDATRKYDYQIWVYVYPISNEYSALDLPKDVAAALKSELTVTEGTGDKAVNYYAKILDLTIERLNGDEDDLERFGSVVSFVIRFYK